MTAMVPVDALREMTQSLFLAAGQPEEDAKLCAGVFLLQEMRGVATHGFRRLKQHLGGLVNGSVNVRPQITVRSETPGTIVLDADNALGMVGCMRAMQRAIEKAEQYGIGQALVIDSNHFLAAAPYCLRASEEGLIGICFSNTGLAMAYPGTNTPALGNGPIGYSIPTAAGFPIVFDGALTLSGGKLTQWAQEGRPIPEAFLGLDAQGKATSDPAEVLSGGVPLPIGLHKGAGLSILLEVLTGVLGGGDYLHRDQGRRGGTGRRRSYTQTCIAIDIAHFMPLAAFQERIGEYIADLKSKPLAPGYDEILLPGERANRSVEQCLRDGVLLDDEVSAVLRDCGRMAGVEMSIL